MSKIYMITTADEYEFPICMADSWRSLSQKSGIHVSTLYNGYRRESVIEGKYKVFVID